jgi:hypothetical protein
VTTSTNDDKGVTASIAGVSGRFSDILIDPGALTLADPDGGVIYERGRSVALGDWTSIPFDASSFLTDVGTWTVVSGNVATLGYSLVGSMMFFTFYLNHTTVSGSPNVLKIPLPPGIAAFVSAVWPITTRENATFATGAAQVVAGQRGIYCMPSGFANWTNTTNGTGLWSAFALPVTISASLVSRPIGSPSTLT